MSQVKVAAIAAVVALVLSMVGAASASAGPMNWFVNGTELKSGEAAGIAEPQAVDVPAVLNVPNLSLKVTCSGFSGSKGELQGANAGESGMEQAEAVVLEECSEISPAVCKLTSSTLVTEPLLASVSLAASRPLPSVRVLLRAKGRNELMTIDFEGSGGKECALAGELGVAGEFLAVAPTGASEETLQAIEGLGTTENNSLQIDGDKAYIEGGRALVKL